MNSSSIISRFIFLLTISPLAIFGQNVKNNSPKKTIQQAVCNPVLSLGNLTGPNINVDSFKAQKGINVTCGLKLQSATVYLSGTNFKNVIVATLFGDQLTSMSEFINKCDAGSVITFDNVKVLTPKDGVRTIEGKSFTLYRGSYDTTRVTVSTANKEVYQLMKKGFVSGTIYFSGANFPNVVIQQIKKNEPIINLFARCGPGSIIAFENCIYQNEDGSLSKPLTKTIKLD